jgi:hypothetical protein
VLLNLVNTGWSYKIGVITWGRRKKYKPQKTRKDIKIAQKYWILK